MLAFLAKVLELTRKYRGRVTLGVICGVIGGICEPLMVATVVFVYSLVFPSGVTTSTFLSTNDLRDSTVLVEKLSQGVDPVSRLLWAQFPAGDRDKLLDRGMDRLALRDLLVRDLNRSLVSPELYALQLTNAPTSAVDVRAMADEVMARSNRRFLSQVFPGELADSSGGGLSTFRLVPEPFRSKLGELQERLLSGRKVRGGFAVCVIALIPLMILLRNVFSYLNIYFLQWTSIRAITDLRTRLFEHLVNLSTAFFNRTTSGELMSRTLNDTNTLQWVLSNAAPVMIKDPVTLLGLVTYLLWQQPRLTLISMVVMPLCMVPVLIYNQKIRRSAKAMQAHVAELSGVMSEAFTGFRVVKAYNLEATMVARFRETAAKFIGHYMRIIRAMEIPGPLLELVGAIGVSLVLLYLLALGNARPNGADFLAVILSIFSMYRPLKNLTRLYSNLEQARAASGRVFELLSLINDVPEPAQPKPLRAAGAVIEFDGIDFSYGDKRVLSEVRLKVEPGKLVALVGESGSGKTSLVNLLLRFYDVEKGAIRIGGTDIRQVTTRDLRSQIAVVTQETILFNETIARNIELGRIGATREEIVAAAGHAHAAEFILEKPEGFETVVGEKGAVLSGGQRQRIAIARALLRNAPILILDEATSALDTESERAVQAALEELMLGRTTICIAHRLSTVQKADRIVVLDHGRIAESGTHEELLKAGGLYKRLYELQFRTESPA